MSSSHLQHVVRHSFPPCLATDVDNTNIALASRGTSCSASISAGTCSRALDGANGNVSSEWRFTGSPVGEWIELTFDGFYTLRMLRLIQGVAASLKNFAQLTLTFSDGSTQQVRQTVTSLLNLSFSSLRRVAGERRKLIDSFLAPCQVTLSVADGTETWERFILDTPVVSNSVRITVDTSRGLPSNALGEVQFYTNLPSRLHIACWIFVSCGEYRNDRIS